MGNGLTDEECYQFCPGHPSYSNVTLQRDCKIKVVCWTAGRPEEAPLLQLLLGSVGLQFSLHPQRMKRCHLVTSPSFEPHRAKDGPCEKFSFRFFGATSGAACRVTPEGGLQPLLYLTAMVVCRKCFHMSGGGDDTEPLITPAARTC